MSDTTTPRTEEMAELAYALSLDLVATVQQRRPQPDPQYFLGSGKMEDVRETTRALGAKLVLVNGALKAGQVFALQAFLGDEAPKDWICVYPFVRSYEWYLLEDAERRRLLAEHGKMARDYPDVRANTVASFALGDYEWLLAFEADDLSRIVDLMRHLRGSETRRHVREEVPFYTGSRVGIADLVDRLP